MMNHVSGRIKQWGFLSQQGQGSWLCNENLLETDNGLRLGLDTFQQDNKLKYTPRDAMQRFT